MTIADRWAPLNGLLPVARLERLESYARELETWNRSIRLVGPRDVGGIRAQVVDAVLPFLLFPPRFPLLDVGSGAGLPGLAIAVASGFFGVAPANVGVPAVVCLEAQSKRVSFLRHALRVLELHGVAIVEGRAEDVAVLQGEMAEGFATVTARAVGDVVKVLSLCRPFARRGGKAVLPRGDEAPAVVDGWELESDKAYQGPPGMGARKCQVYRRVD